MSVEELMMVVPPPKKPLDLGNDKVWDRIQKEMGIELPTDLCDFALRYGTGRLCNNLLRVFNPFSAEYKEYVLTRCDRVRNEGSPPYPAYPVLPGLYPWGGDDNSSSMYWFTDGTSDKWPIILRTREGKYERWDLPMTTFLAKALTNEIRCILWKGFSKKDLAFKQVDF